MSGRVVQALDFRAGVKRAFYWAAISFILGAWAVPARAAGSEAEMREAIDTIISMRHPSDNADWWHRLAGDEPAKLVGLLISMHEASTSTYQKLRLVQALAWFDDPAAVAFLKSQAKASPQDDVIRNAAIRSIGTSQGAKERDFIAGFLQNGDPDTRYAAAAALKRIGEGDPSSAQLLDKYLASEKTPWIGPKLRGDLPVAVRAPSQSASSEDSPAKLIAGVWRGFWLSPETKPKNGLASEIATLDAKARTEDSTLSASLTLLAGGKGRVFRLENVTRRGNSLKGSLKPTAPTATGEGLAFSGEVSGEDADRQLEIKIPTLRTTLLLRRDP